MNRVDIINKTSTILCYLGFHKSKITSSYIVPADGFALMIMHSKKCDKCGKTVGNSATLMNIL